MNLIGQRFALVDVDHAQAAEIAVLGAERAVGDGHVLNQLGAERFQRAQVALPVALCALVLLHVVHQHLEAAVDAAVVEVETEAANLERLAAALVLAGVDPGIELLQHLVVAREQRAVEDLRIPQVQLGLQGLSGNYDALVLCRQLGQRHILDGELTGERKTEFGTGQAGGFNSEVIGAVRDRIEPVPAFAVRTGTQAKARRGFQLDGRPGHRCALRIEHAP